MNGDPGAGPLAERATREPRGVGEILSEAFNLYKHNALAFIITAAVAMGPVYLIKDAIVAIGFAPAAVSGLDDDTREMERLQREMEQAQEEGASPEELQRLAARQMELAGRALTKGAGAMAGIGFAIVGLLLSIPFIILAMFLAQAALTVIVADRASGGTMKWQQAWAVVGRHLGALLVTTLLAVVGVAVGLVLCVVPGLVFGLLAAFAVQVVLLERKGGMAAIRRSMELVKSDWLRVAIVLIVFGILQGIASWLGSLFVPARFVFLDMLVGDLVSILVVPIPIIGLVLLYLDLIRTRSGEEQVRAQREALLR